MKIKLKILSLIACLSSFSFGYDNIDEALKNGVTKGDVIFYGNYQGLSKGVSQNFTPDHLATYSYFGNIGYLLGSIRLGYTSGFYKNVRASISFASSLSIYDRHKNLPSATGKLDSQTDFFDHNQASLGESFFEYFDGDTSLKGGRITISNEWSNTLADGIWFRNKSLDKLLIEAFWARTFGRIDYFQMTDFRDINSRSSFGIANIGAKYDIFGNLLSTKAYIYFAPRVFTAFGWRLNSDFQTETINAGADFGATYSIENLQKNAYEIDISAYIGFKEIIKLKGGYIHTSKDSGWGSLNLMGDNIAPFFVWGGKAVRTQKNANLFYATLSSKVKLFTFFITYATTSFDAFNTTARQNEIDFSTEVSVTENIFILFNLMNTHLSSSVIPTTTQINGGIRLKF